MGKLLYNGKELVYEDQILTKDGLKIFVPHEKLIDGSASYEFDRAYILARYC